MKNISLDVLTAPGCVHCHEFETYWGEIAKDWPNVTHKEISIITPEGQELVSKHQIFASPGILLNGEVWATGGFNKEQFLEKLKALSGEEAPGA
ncbi:MAG TPA: thioredoxin family protein [Candidatus Paceibacterota bacterium]|nr:thioredoxin family protein [Candidatus Paceibacterota bacterium]